MKKKKSLCQFLTFRERIKIIEHGEGEAIILNISIKGFAMNV